jgi:hypothetical protein
MGTSKSKMVKSKTRLSNGTTRIRKLLGWTREDFKATWSWGYIRKYWPVYLFWIFSLSLFFTHFVLFFAGGAPEIFQAFAVIMLRTPYIRYWVSIGIVFLSALFLVHNLLQKNNKIAVRFSVYVVFMSLWSVFVWISFTTS